MFTKSIKNRLFIALVSLGFIAPISAMDFNDNWDPLRDPGYPQKLEAALKEKQNTQHVSDNESSLSIDDDEAKKQKQDNEQIKQKEAKRKEQKIKDDAQKAQESAEVEKNSKERKSKYDG